jgi:23S rRNA pseudouridine1911/1915/1917 synthase
MPLTFTVPDDADGQRLDRILTTLLPDRSRAQVQKLIEDGHVMVTRKAAKSNLAMRAGEPIEVDAPAPVASTVEPEELPITVLHEDADVIVIDKAAGMVVHPGAGHGSGTLVNALLHHVDDLSGIGGELRPGIVHRLDKGTSGVMVVAKHDAAHQELSRQFQDREVEKEYIALVWGGVQAGRRIDAAIGRDPSNRQKMSARARYSREAVTRITRAWTWKGLSLVHVAIHTGRTHQIRVHLSAIGHPVVGDALYGGVRRRVPGDIRAVNRLDRPFLHAWRLAFSHPVHGNRMEFRAPLPPELLTVLLDLGYEGPMGERSTGEGDQPV